MNSHKNARLGFAGRVCLVERVVQDGWSAPAAASPHRNVVLQAVDALNTDVKPRSLWSQAWRDLRRNPLFIASAVFTQYVALSPSGGWSWEARALTCLAWPLVCAGLLRMGGARSPRDEGYVLERRRTLLFAGVVALLLAARVADANLQQETIELGFGVPVSSYVQPELIMGVEVFRNPANAPFEYQYAFMPDCPVVLIWTNLSFGIGR